MSSDCCTQRYSAFCTVWQKEGFYVGAACFTEIIYAATLI